MFSKIASPDFGERLKKLLASTKNQTAKEELRKLLRNNLLRRIGHQLGLKTLFVGDCANRLAVQLITNTALGRGKHLPLELGYADTRDPDFTIVRPFKDVTMKEISMYNELRLNGIISKKVSKHTLTRKYLREKTIDDITLHYVTLLITLSYSRGNHYC